VQILRRDTQAGCRRPVLSDAGVSVESDGNGGEMVESKGMKKSIPILASAAGLCFNIAGLLLFDVQLAQLAVLCYILAALEAKP